MYSSVCQGKVYEEHSKNFYELQKKNDMKFSYEF